MERNSGVLARETKRHRPRAAGRTHVRTVSLSRVATMAVGRTWHGYYTSSHLLLSLPDGMHACDALHSAARPSTGDVYTFRSRRCPDSNSAQQHAYHATGRMHLGHALLINQANSRRIIAVIVLCRLLSRACFTKKRDKKKRGSHAQRSEQEQSGVRRIKPWWPLKKKPTRASQRYWPNSISRHREDNI
jgi:hypothetical protein